jgi:hypothetical protein
MIKMFITFGFLVALNFAVVPKADASLVGYWNFNEGVGDVANDSSGSGNHASGLESSWVSGKYGFGTTSSNIVVPPDPSLLPSTNLSITAWAKIDEFNGLQRRIAEMEYRYGLLFNPPNIDLETPFLFNINADMYGFEFQDPEIGEWFHAAVSWDGNVVQFYYNGVPATPIAVTATIDQTGGVPLRMGAQGYTLDEVRVYNNAISRQQVIRDMNFDSAAVPEPATMLLLASGLAGAVSFRTSRRKRKEIR